MVSSLLLAVYVGLVGPLPVPIVPDLPGVVPDCQNTGLQGGVQALSLGGRAGVWFPQASAQRVLDCLNELEAVSHRNALLRELADLRLREIRTLTQKVEVDQRILAGFGQKLATADQAVRAAQDARDVAQHQLQVWYRNPWLFATVGLLAGGAFLYETVKAVR